VIDPDARDDLGEVLAGLRRFLDTAVVARHERHRELLDNPRAVYDDTGNYTSPVLDLIRAVRIEAAQAGYYTMFVPGEVGGEGMGFRALFRVWECVFRHCGGPNWLGNHAIAHWTRGPSFLLGHLASPHKEDVLPGLLAGQTSMCFAMSEPDAGSDLWGMSTRAIRDGDGWRINGTKQWITGAAAADYAIVFAVTDADQLARHVGGITAFFVPTSSRGFAVDSTIRTFGSPGGSETIVSLADVFAPQNAVVGTLDRGLQIGLQGISTGRIFNAARAVGLGRWALERALTYASNRSAFGQAIADYQAVSFPLVDSAIELHAARLMALDCARLLDSGAPAIKELAMVKAFSTEVGGAAVDRAMQIHGAMGFTNELGLAEAWQHLRKARIADGSAEVMRRQIAKRLLAGDVDL
jgi:alkylation response protein AidB-like acyl-CoA dehydrogenase